MNRKTLPKPCLDTNKEFRPVKVRKHGNKKVYEVNDKDGGILKLIVNLPTSKLAQKIRDMLFVKTKR